MSNLKHIQILLSGKVRRSGDLTEKPLIFEIVKDKYSFRSIPDTYICRSLIHDQIITKEFDINEIEPIITSVQIVRSRQILKNHSNATLLEAGLQILKMYLDPFTKSTEFLPTNR